MSAVIPKLLYPGFKKNVKPLVPVTLDHSNPLSRHLISYVLFNAGAQSYRDLANPGNFYYRNGGTEKPDIKSGERCIDLNAASDVGEEVYSHYPSIPESSDFTVVMRVYNGNSGFTQNMLFGQYAGGQSGRFVVENRNTSGIYVFDGAAVQYITGADAINAPRWDDIAVWRSGTTMGCVVNSSESTSNITTSANLYQGVGTQVGGPLANWRGYISYFSVYGKRLSYSEIQSIFSDRYQMLRPINQSVPISLSGAPEPSGSVPPALHNIDRQFSTITASRLGGVIQ